MPSRKSANSYGKKLRAARERKGVGLRELAAMAGVHPTYLSKIELGHLPPPNWDKKLAFAYQLKDETLMDEALAEIDEQDLKSYELIVKNMAETIRAMTSLVSKHPAWFQRMWDFFIEASRGLNDAMHEHRQPGTLNEQRATKRDRQTN